MKIIHIENSKKLATEVADLIGVELGKSVRKNFADSEFTVGYQESLEVSEFILLAALI